MNDNNNDSGNDLLVVAINGEAVLEYDRRKPLPGFQQAYLQRMDQKMDRGLRLGGEQISSPDMEQRARFVAIHLIEALQQENEAHAAASCAWLAGRIPALKQVRADINGVDVQVDLVFDRVYSKQVSVDLKLPETKRRH